MALDLDLGVDLSIVDDPPPSNPPTATDTGFLLHSLAQEASPDDVQFIRTPSQARDVYEGEAALIAATDAYFACGGSKLYVAPLLTDEAASVAVFDDQLGPGQLMAPEVVAALDQEALKDWAWDHNRIYIAQAPDGAAVAALETLADTLIDESSGRFAMLEADRLIIPGAAPGATREVAASVVKGALMARSDRITGNPNLAAAGNHTPGAGGQANYVLSVKNERSVADQKTLAQAQVNSFRTVNNRVRSYGYWTLADLAVIPHWWDMGGSRTMMAVRAEEQAAAEELMFGQVAADGAFLDRYKSALSAVLSRFQRDGAIYGTEENPGYSVDVSATINPTENVARGLITAIIKIRTSPFAAELAITLSRRAITESVV